MGWFMGRWPISPAVEQARYSIGRPFTAADWLPGETRTVALPEGSLTIFGRCSVTDEQLVAGFPKDGALPEVAGACAMIGVRGSELLLRGDLAAQYPIFFLRRGAEIVFASHASLIARTDRFPPDTGWMLTRLICPDTADTECMRTSYIGVQRLPPGATLRAGPNAMSVDILSPAPPSGFTGLVSDAYVNGVREALLQAISTRVESAAHVSADFSGGLDSTSLAYLMCGHVTPLPVFTYYNAQTPVADDLDRARDLAAGDPRFDHHLVAGGQPDLPYVGLTAAPVSDEPEATGVAPARDALRLRAVAAAGSTLHVTGEGGDAVFAAPPGYLADLVRAGDLRRLRDDATAWARLRHRAPAALMLRAVRASRTSLGAALHRLADRVQADPGRLPREKWEDAIGYWRMPGEEIGWLTGRAARLLAQELRARADVAARSEDLGVGDYAARAELAASGAASRLLRSRGETYGIAVHAPYLDDAVVRACLRVPAWYRMDPRVPKKRLREALRGDVPARVLDRRTKGNYQAEAYRGIRAAATVLRELLIAPACADLGLIEPAPVREVLDRARLGLPIPWAAFNRLLAMELWLRAMDAECGRHGDEQS